MRILVTNDDGIDAPGLWVLAAALAARGGDVVVAAPATNMSGTGTAIQTTWDGAGVRLDPRKPPVDLDLDLDLPAWAVWGTPALCTLLAQRGAFGVPPTLVVSGPNLGANVGWDVQHSGTVGAAMAAVKHGISAVAVSLAIGLPWGDDPRAKRVYDEVYKQAATNPAPALGHHWSTAAVFACDLAFALADRGASPMLANLNVPDLPADAVTDVRTTVPAAASPMHFDGFDETVADDGARILRPRFTGVQHTAGDGTDIGALLDGAASVTWLAPPGPTAGDLEWSELAGIWSALPE